MQKQASDSQLVISYVGFTSDTLSIQNSKTIIHILKRKDGANLDEVVVSERLTLVRVLLPSQFQLV